MKIYSEIIGNLNHSDEWKDKLVNAEIDYVFLDQWTAQKSRFLGKGISGTEYPIALARHSQIVDGDILEFDPKNNKAIVLKIELSPVLVVNLNGLAHSKPEDIIRISLELGHAIGNQHWPAVVKGTKVYVPLTVDKKVMMSVMETHHIEGIKYDFQKGVEIIPYLAPHEIRRLFGGAGHESHSHEHDHGHIVHAHEHSHSHEHVHGDMSHNHEHNHVHQHSNGDEVHSHDHVHDDNEEHDHQHPHCHTH
ncbi:MAG: urease accessory protein UreE [Muribaculaceae bacterium]|nr:urease accessory protein UreE [Muribaculaceae bacterium]